MHVYQCRLSSLHNLTILSTDLMLSCISFYLISIINLIIFTNIIFNFYWTQYLSVATIRSPALYTRNLLWAWIWLPVFSSKQVTYAFSTNFLLTPAVHRLLLSFVSFFISFFCIHFLYPFFIILFFLYCYVSLRYLLIAHQIVRGLSSTLTYRSFRTTIIHYLFPILSIGDNLPALNSSCKSLSISVQLTGLDSQDTLQHHSQIAALLVDLGKREI